MAISEPLVAPEVVEGMIAVVDIRAGDTVVIMCKERLSIDAVERIQKLVRGRFPEDVQVLVMDSGATLGVIRKVAE